MLSILMAVFSFLFYHPWRTICAIHGTAVRTQEKKSRERSERLETIEISVAQQHRNGAYSKSTKKSRAQRGDADIQIAKRSGADMEYSHQSREPKASG